MEEMNIQQLQYILTEDLFLIREEFDSATGNAAHSQKGNKNKIQKSESFKSEEDFIPAKEPIHYEGNFENGVLILHEEEKLAPEVMDMLVKMINAVNHSMNEVGMISSKNLEGRSLEEFMDLNAHRVLKFGRIKHPINALPALDYTVHTEDETEYLFADALTVISEDRALKLKLWDSLKILFNISKK
jgi:hypothetical protein